MLVSAKIIVKAVENMKSAPQAVINDGGTIFERSANLYHLSCF